MIKQTGWFLMTCSVLCLSSFTAAGALSTWYSVQLSAVPTEGAAKVLVETLAGQTDLPLRTVTYQGQSYVLAGEFDTEGAAAEAAKVPAFKDFFQLDVVRITTDEATLAPGTTVHQIQLGYFTTPTNARRAQQQAEQAGLKPVFTVEEGEGHKVRYGRFSQRDAAEKELVAVQNRGYKDAWITSSTFREGGQIQQVVELKPLGLFASSQTGTASPALPPTGGSPDVTQLSRIELPAPDTPPQVRVQQDHLSVLPMAETSGWMVKAEPVHEAKKKKAIPIAAQAEGADQLTLHYRLKGGVSYIKAPMEEHKEGLWTAEIPGWAVTSLGVEYFIRAVATSQTCFPSGTEEQPQAVTVR